MYRLAVTKSAPPRPPPPPGPMPTANSSPIDARNCRHQSPRRRGEEDTATPATGEAAGPAGTATAATATAAKPSATAKAGAAAAAAAATATSAKTAAAAISVEAATGLPAGLPASHRRHHHRRRRCVNRVTPAAATTAAVATAGSYQLPNRGRPALGRRARGNPGMLQDRPSATATAGPNAQPRRRRHPPALPPIPPPPPPPTCHPSTTLPISLPTAARLPPVALF